MFVSETNSQYDKAICIATLRSAGLKLEQKTKLGTVVGVCINTITKTPFVMFCKNDQIHSYTVKAVKNNLL